MARSPIPSLKASAVSQMRRSWRSRIPSLSMTAVPKLSAILSAWALSGQVSRTISTVTPLRSGRTRADWRGLVAGLAMSFPFRSKRFRPRAGLPFGAVAPNRRKPGASRSGHGKASGADLRASRAEALR
ncbi:hypothetical protein D9M72_616540 [compost metagenome]